MWNCKKCSSKCCQSHISWIQMFRVYCLIQEYKTDTRSEEKLNIYAGVIADATLFYLSHSLGVVVLNSTLDQEGSMMEPHALSIVVTSPLPAVLHWQDEGIELLIGVSFQGSSKRNCGYMRWLLLLARLSFVLRPLQTNHSQSRWSL